MLITDLKYDGYDTGLYGDIKAGGLTLHFSSETTSLHYYTIFNVNLTRQRGSNRGAQLPKKRFWITNKFLFNSFWHQTCGLPEPSKGLSSFHDCMGKLKLLTFQAQTVDGKRLVTKTIEPMSPDKPPITTRQLSDKVPIISPDKHLEKTKAMPDFEEILTTCKTNYGISKQGKTDTRIPITNTEKVREQTNDEWLKDADTYF